MDYREIPVESLLLDPMNPRHGVEVEGQEEVINAFLQDRTKAQHLIQLAKDIAEHGPSPIDLALVVRKTVCTPWSRAIGACWR